MKFTEWLKLREAGPAAAGGGGAGGKGGLWLSQGEPRKKTPEEERGTKRPEQKDPYNHTFTGGAGGGAAGAAPVAGGK